MPTDKSNRTEITGSMGPGYESILTPEAREFLAALALNFDPPRRELLAQRQMRQAEIDAGILPGFLPRTEQIRRSDW